MAKYKPTKELHVEMHPDSRVEIVAHKQATKREVTKVKKANEVLNNLFDDNHFTVKLVLASKE